MAGGVDHFHVQPVNIPAVDVTDGLRPFSSAQWAMLLAEKVVENEKRRVEDAEDELQRAMGLRKAADLEVTRAQDRLVQAATILDGANLLLSLANDRLQPTTAAG